MALVLQFLSTKIFQRTLSFLAQENQLRISAGVVPVLRVQRYDFSRNHQRNMKVFFKKMTNNGCKRDNKREKW